MLEITSEDSGVFRQETSTQKESAMDNGTIRMLRALRLGCGANCDCLNLFASKLELRQIELVKKTLLDKAQELLNAVIGLQAPVSIPAHHDNDVYRLLCAHGFSSDSARQLGNTIREEQKMLFVHIALKNMGKVSQTAISIITKTVRMTSTEDGAEPDIYPDMDIDVKDSLAEIERVMGGDDFRGTRSYPMRHPANEFFDDSLSSLGLFSHRRKKS